MDPQSLRGYYGSLLAELYPQTHGLAARVSATGATRDYFVSITTLNMRFFIRFLHTVVSFVLTGLFTRSIAASSLSIMLFPHSSIEHFCFAHFPSTALQSTSTHAQFRIGRSILTCAALQLVGIIGAVSSFEMPCDHISWATHRVGAHSSSVWLPILRRTRVVQLSLAQKPL